ncbi:MAG TPA: DUF1800 domain-containing protein [Candidatus Polarisedimenticolia bacterium]|jgi:uncharacterized protein (DUF1800 family)|nr:DUF1800 domain-containing protein [Candidatus Polarisedimenticolia bacterium]
MLRLRGVRLPGVLSLALLFGIGTASAAPPTAGAAAPGEVSRIAAAPASVFLWTSVTSATSYNVYRGLVSSLHQGDGAECHGRVPNRSLKTTENPPVGDAFYYLVTAESDAGGEGTIGTGTGGRARPLRGTCDGLLRHHVLERIGFGESDWSRARIAALGLQGYIDEQLNPASIDESDNTALLSRRAPLVPPDGVSELNALDVVNAVYSRRQLEQQVTMFWDNHFNTCVNETTDFFGFYDGTFESKQNFEAANLLYQAQKNFRSLAFNGTFRQILEASGLGAAMIIYLDSVSNVAGTPNENYARELLELHTMGVDGGYTQQDIVQLAKVFSGWNVCKKDVSVASDPLSTCIASNIYGTASEPPGVWVASFEPVHHDSSEKILFAGTPYQAVIPSTAFNRAAGVNDARLAFDAIAAHPSTPRFIAKKLLQRFVDEQPTTAMIDAVVAAWNNPANPHGAGDLREVLRAVLAQTAFRDPARVGGKIKTPFEHVVSALRAVRASTDGTSIVEGYLTRMSELFHRNPVPTGYSEIGGDWLDTNNLLERRNFGMTAAASPSFAADVIGMLHDHGVVTAAQPNNAAAIVDDLSSMFFGSTLSAAERQRAIDYLNTDDNGLPSPYDDGRIRETAGYLLGFAQFLEQ